MPIADEPEQRRKPDLRFTNRVDQGVSVERDLSATGHLARGDGSHMSSIRFSAQAKPRDYLDPELAVLHDETSTSRQPPRETPDVTQPVRSPDAVGTPLVPPPTVIGRIVGAIRRFASAR